MVLGLFLSIGLTMAQERVLTGTVYDGTTSEPMPGATVVIKGTTTGATTDLDGNFQLNVTDGQIVTISFVGYLTEEITIAGQSSIEVSLTPELTELTEIVVIGYGTQKKVDKTGAVAQVTAEELNSGSLSDPLMAITGKAAGVVVTKGGGDPNRDVKIKIRGSSGIAGASNTNPLYVIDGIPDADPNMVAPEDIETFNILKDAASTAIYGSRGANGVVIITTKKGKEGKASLFVNTSTSINQISKKLDLLSAYKYRIYSDYFFPNDWTDGGADTDWQDEIFTIGLTQNTNIGASGGSEKGDYYASVTNSVWEGTIRGSRKDRTTANIKVNHQAFNDKVLISANLLTAFEKNDLIDYGDAGREDVLYQAYRMNPTDPVRDAEGNINYDRVTENRGFNYINPVGIIEDIQKNDTKKKILGSLKFDWEIINGLHWSATGSYLSNDKEYKYYRPKGVYGGQGDDRGAASRYYQVATQKILETYLNYDASYNGVHNLSAVLGYSWQENNYTNFGVNTRNAQSISVGYDNLQSFLELNWRDAESSANMSRLIGFFGRVNYNYDSKYYIAGSLRADGSSRFGEDHKWGIFPTASIAWNMHREAFLSSSDVVSQLKLRGSYGVSGNQPNDPYWSQSLYSPDVFVTDPVTGQEVLTWTTNRNANPNLKWEETTEINTGVDYGFLNNKLSGTFEFYDKTTDDLLNEWSVSGFGEFLYNTLYANEATIKNQGWEFYLMWNALAKTNITWKTSFAVSQNKSKVTETGQYWVPESDGRKGYLSGDGMVAGDNWTLFIEENEPIGNIFVYEFGYFENNQLYIKNNHKESEDEDDYYREDNTQYLDSKDRKIYGNTTPDIEFSWGNYFTFYKQWSLDFSFRALLGQQIYNHTSGFFSGPNHMPERNMLEDGIDYMSVYRGGAFTKPINTFVEDASFLRLDYISLGYDFNFPNTDVIKKLKLSLNANNLFVITKYSGSDPEMTIDGVDYGVDNFSIYPKSRTITFSINAIF
jgi:iron complex outermembrane receptor protein